MAIEPSPVTWRRLRQVVGAGGANPESMPGTPRSTARGVSDAANPARRISVDSALPLRREKLDADFGLLPPEG
jgi:hypothetical protein